jgi:hypothetical protein
MTLITTSKLLPEPWPGLSTEWQTSDKQDSSMANTRARSRYCSTNPVTRNRYCLRSPNGYATENGFTQNPAEAIQLVDHEAAARRVLFSGRHDLLPHPVTFQFDGDHWTPVTTA